MPDVARRYELENDREGLFELTEGALAVGDDEIGGFFSCLKINIQPRNSRRSVFFLGASLDHTDNVIATCRNLGEPEVAGWIGSGGAKIGEDSLVLLQLSYSFLGAVQGLVCCRCGIGCCWITR